MKKSVLTAILATSVLTFTACSKDDGEVVVEFENGSITKDELYEEMKLQVGKDAIHALLMEKILLDKYEQTEDEIKEMEEIISVNKEQYGDDFEQVLQESGYQNEEDYRTALIANQLYARALNEAKEKVKVSEEDINKKFEEMKQQRRVSHILVKDLDTANKILDELNEGADFAQLAKEHSTDPGTAQAGGDLGFIGPDANLVQPFLDTAFSLKEGEISEPVESSYGFHIIKVTEDNSDIVLDEVKEDIIASLQEEQFNTSDFMNQLMEEAKVNIKIEEFKDMYKTQEVSE
jgi:foldase protein PrsA